MSKEILFVSILLVSLLGRRQKPDFAEDRQGVGGKTGDARGILILVDP